jgi:predicted permease
VEGREPERDRSRPLTWTSVAGDYFQAMGVPLLAGRHFNDRDAAQSPLVAIIDERMADRYWPGEDPIGKRFKGQDARGANDDWLTVIGVVRSARRQGLERDATPHVYEWWRQTSFTNDWVIRTAADPARLAAAIRAAVRETDARAAISNFMTMDAQIESQTAARRFQTWLLSIFAGLALLLALFGIYGVISYATVQRTREIGIRMALGARPVRVIGMVLRQGMTLVVAGLAIGVAAALVVAKLISGLLFRVTPDDPVTYCVVGAMLLFVAVCATLLPALRATRVDPLMAIRME